MAAEQPGPSAASCCTEKPTLVPWPWDEGEEEDEKDPEHNKEISSGEELNGSQRSSSDESEPEPPPPSLVRRKVSFADAFGLDLVSVKEFDSRPENGPESLGRLIGVETREGEEYYLSCLFIVPSSNDELSSLLQQKKLELESIELLPGSTTIRGIIRVLNLSYHKAIYVRTTLDGWQSHFDLLAEYIPGSSDGQTDRFCFKLTLVPPFQPAGVQVEFCLRYESPVGTFWANNGGTNYVLFCHQRGARELKEKEGEKDKETEESNHKGKKSCLKASRKPPGASGDLSEPESSRSEESEEEKSQHEEESRSSEALEACRKALVERRNRRRAARLARMQDYFSQREDEVQSGFNLNRESTERALKVVMPAPQLSTPVDVDTSEEPHVDKRKDQDTPPILTYHQIPLLSLNWGEHITTPTRLHAAEISSVTSSDVPQKQFKSQESTGSSTDAREAFLSGADSSDTHANTVDQECLLCVASLPSQTECDMSIPGENGLPAKTAEGQLTNKSQGCFRSEETLEPGPAARWQVFNSSHIKEQALGYKYLEKPGITSETHNVQESELVWVQAQSAHVSSEKPFSEDASLPETEIVDATEFQNPSKGHGISPEECAVSPDSLDAKEEEVNGETGKEAPLTFTGTSDEPLIGTHMEKGESLEKQHTDETTEPQQVKDNIKDETENGTQMKVNEICNKYPEDLIVGVEGPTQGHDEEPSLMRDQSMDVTPVSERMVTDEEELHTRTEWTDRVASKTPKHEDEDEVSPKPEKEEIAKISEEMLFVVDVAEINSTSEIKAHEESYIFDEIICGKKSRDYACKDFITVKEPHSTNNTCTNTPTLFITSHNSDPSWALSWTESVSESLLFSGRCKGFESGENKTARDLEELQNPQDSAYPPSLSRTATPSPSGDSTSFRLSAWWAVFCSLSHISRALLYVILFVIFITVDFYDLPVCLTIYLLSVCWWCGQGMKKRVATADNVD